MAPNFSVSLRETARLYLRYMMVGLVSVPLALFYAWAKHANWNASVVITGLLLLGLVSTFFVWRRLGERARREIVIIISGACHVQE